VAALEFRSAVDGGDASLTTSSVAVSLPSGTASGDLMTVWAGAAVFAPSSAPTISTPSGWTLAGSQAVSIASGAINAWLHLFYRVAGASEGSVTLDTGGTNAIFAYVRQSHRNPAASPFGQVSWGSGGPGTSAALGSLTTTSDNALLAAFVVQGVTQDITPPASMTERVDNATYGIAAADEVFPEAGAAGTRTFALPSSSDYAWGIAEFASAVTPPDASSIPYPYPHRFSRAARAGRLALAQGQRKGDSIKTVAEAAFFGATVGSGASVSNAASATVASAVAGTQAHAGAVANAASATAASTVSGTIAVQGVVANAASATAAGTAAGTQAHVGSVAAAASAATASAPAGTQTHAGAVANAASATAAGTAAGTQAHAGSVAAAASATAVSTPAGSVVGQPAVSNAASATTASAVAGTQAHAGAVANAASATAASTVSGTIAVQGGVANAATATAAGSAAGTQAHAGVVAAASSATAVSTMAGSQSGAGLEILGHAAPSVSRTTCSMVRLVRAAAPAVSRTAVSTVRLARRPSPAVSRTLTSHVHALP